jgi:acyl dehydratase
VIAQSVVGRVLCDHVAEVPRAQLQLFAKAIHDALPEHVDAEAARTAGYPDVFVPPTWLFGLELMQPDPFGWVAQVGGDLSRMLHGTQSSRFHPPLSPGTCCVCDLKGLG